MRDTQLEPLRCQCSEQGLHRIADEVWWRTKIRPNCDEVMEMIAKAQARQHQERTREAR
jgi:hypothetical protein